MEHALLHNLMGITETKIGILDILIKLAKKQKGKIYLGDLVEIKEGLIEEAKKSELKEIFEKLEEDQRGE